jgi:hypothetical protein
VYLLLSGGMKLREMYLYGKTVNGGRHDKKILLPAEIFSFDLLPRIRAALQRNKGYTCTFAITVIKQKRYYFKQACQSSRH